jgi:hypothetical protein
MKKKMNLLSLLGHPAWNGIAVLVAIIGLFGIGVVYLFFKDLFNHIITFLLIGIRVPIVVIIIFAFVLLALSINFIQRQIKVKNKPQSGYYTVWKVLWTIGNNIFGKQQLYGPYCPIHHLQMEMSLKNNKYLFRCFGDQYEKPHEFSGPNLDELIITPDIKKLPLSPEEKISFDVIERIGAINRKLYY